MPFLALVHLHALTCATCRAPLASAGARSFIVDAAGNAIDFDENDMPAEMTVELRCPNAHPTTSYVPNELAAEPALLTPEEAPIGADALLLEGTTEAGTKLAG